MNDESQPLVVRVFPLTKERTLVYVCLSNQNWRKELIAENGVNTVFYAPLDQRIKQAVELDREAMENITNFVEAVNVRTQQNMGSIAKKIDELPSPLSIQAELEELKRTCSEQKTEIERLQNELSRKNEK